MRGTSFWIPIALTACAATSSGQSTAPRPRAMAITELSDSFERLASTTTRAVVQINVSGYTLSADPDAGSVVALAKERGVGSGVVLAADGYIVTNAHVVHGGQKITVSFRGQDAFALEEGPNNWPAKLIGVDAETDLAVIKVERTGLPFLTLANSSRVRQGQVVVAFGSPLGLANSMTMGVVSSAARQLAERDFMQYIQTDTPINPGNSGGPLVDANGQVVGINTAILSQSGGSEGIGLAIPASVVGSVYRQLRATGRVRRGMIGINAQQVTPTLMEGLGLARKAGVLITDVGPEGPADRGGLQIGDVVSSVDGAPIRTPRELELRIFRAMADEVVRLQVWRQANAAEIPIEIKVAERPESGDKLAVLTNPREHLIPQLGALGLTIDKTNQSLVGNLRETFGVVVTAHAYQPTAWTDQVKPGDVIHRINGQLITSLDFLREALSRAKPGRAVVLQVENSGSMRFVAFRAE